MSSVLITGSNRGLGLEFARQCLADGWRVFATCRDPAAADQLQHLAKSSGDKLTIIEMDVTDAASVRKAATQIKDVAIDVIINNAGITGVSGQRPGNIDYDSWTRVINVNTHGTPSGPGSLCRALDAQRAQACGEYHERHGFACR